MEMILTNWEVQEFLKDFEISSEISFLVEGREKAELEKVAEARGMSIKNSRDLAIFKTIYAFTDKSNSNGAILPKKELLKVLPQIIGKPVNINHDRQIVVGHYIDYKFVKKSNKVMAYGVFYKSYFPDEFKQAKTLLNKGKLSSSFEIWSPDNKRENIGGGKYKLHKMEIAGGALIYEDKDNVPAFKDAKVLQMARKEIPELVYASKYNNNNIITADKDYFRDSVEENLKKLNKEKKQKLEDSKPEVKKEEPKTKEIAPKLDPKKEVVVPKVEEPVKEVKVEEPKEVKETSKPTEEPKVENNKIKCSNCNEEFEHVDLPDVKIATTVDCPKCRAILKRDGTMIYPPQIIDFKVSCPSCKMGQWLLKARNEKEAQVICSCKKEYILTFAKEKSTEMLDKLQFPYQGSTNCPQCNKWIYYEGISGVTSRNINCPKCSLNFSFDITKMKRSKKIEKISEVEIKKIENSSEQGGNQMKLEKIVKHQANIGKTSEDAGNSHKFTIDENGDGTTNRVDGHSHVIENGAVNMANEHVHSIVEPVLAEKEPSKTEVVKLIDKYAKSKVIRKAIVKIKESTKILTLANQKLDLRKKAIKKMAQLVKKSKTELTELDKSVISLKEEITKIKDESSKKIEFYKANAVKVQTRRAELGDFVNDLTDEQLVNDDKFEKASLEKENAELKSSMEQSSSDIVGLKKKDDGYYTKYRKEINKVAFPKKKKK